MENNKKYPSRSEQRKWAFCLIFEHHFNSDVEPTEIYSLARALISDFADTPYVSSAFYGVAQEREALDGLIEKYAVGWKISRISPVSLSIMRLALYEMQSIDDVPVNVAINEAVELAKAFDTDEAPAFINGILNAACKGENIK